MKQLEVTQSHGRPRLEQNPATVTGERVPNSPFFINTRTLSATTERHLTVNNKMDNNDFNIGEIVTSSAFHQPPILMKLKE